MATIDIKLKSYEQLQFEVSRLFTDRYLLQLANDKLQQENKQLKEDKKKAIEYIKENAFEVVNSEHKTLLNIEELLEILGDKENE